MGIFLFIGVILCFALLEEFLWETLVWNEHFSLDLTVPETVLQFLIPLLVVPQLTHYLLDGFIWKKPKKLANFVLNVKNLKMRQYLLSLAIFLGIWANGQQKTFCNPINIDYGYTPFEAFSKQGKHRATADPVIVNFKDKLFLFLPIRKVTGIAMICSTGSSLKENFSETINIFMI